MRKRIYLISILLAGLLLFCYIFQRAVLLSLTHDESATTDLVSVSSADIMFASSQFQTANNHVLHSLCMKWSVLAFGWKEWSIRLPNVLLFILYYTAAVWYMHRISGNMLIRITGVVIFCTVPYLLDFFSLARGYGMANAFSLAGFVMLVSFFQYAEKKYILFSFCMSALAVYSNFTWLNIYLGLWLLLNVGTIFFFRKRNGQSLIKVLLQNNTYPFLISCILTLLIYKPISFLRKQEEFKWGTSDWITSFNHFISDLQYGHSLTGNQENSIRIIGFCLLTGMIVSVFVFARHLLRYRQNAFADFHSKASLLSLLLLLIIISATIAQRYLLNTFYIDGRKATLYIPILLCFITASGSWLKEKYVTAGNTAWAFLSVLFIYQFWLLFNFKSCREWWYDANSKQAFQIICADSGAAKKTAINWLFTHSFNVYNNHFYNHCIPSIVRTDAPADQLKDVDYYYIIGDEIRNIHPLYRPVKRFFWDRFLLKKDVAGYEKQINSIMQLYQASFPGLPLDKLRTAADSILVKQRKELNWSSVYFTE